jgi:hypothetical protein
MRAAARVLTISTSPTFDGAAVVARVCLNPFIFLTRVREEEAPPTVDAVFSIIVFSVFAAGFCLLEAAPSAGG